MHFRDRPNVGSDLVDKPDRWPAPASHSFYRRCFNEMGDGQMDICWFRRTSLMTFDWTMWVFDIFDFFLRSEFLATEIQKSNENFWKFQGMPQRWIHGILGPFWDPPGNSVDRRTSLLLASCVGCSGLSGTGTAPGPSGTCGTCRDHFLMTEVWSDRSLESMSNLCPIYDIYVESIWICWHLHSDHSVLVPEDTSFVLGMDVWFQAICQSWHGCAPSFLGGTPKNRWMVYFMEKTIYKWMRTGGTLF